MDFNDSNKHSSLLEYGMKYCCENFCETWPGLFL